MINRNPRLKKVYSEIIRGFSIIKSPEFLYIKHPSSVESAELECLYDDFFNEATQANIETIKEREKYLIENGLWDTRKDTEILEWKNFISRVSETKRKLLRKTEIEDLNNQIKEAEIKLIALEIEKSEKLGNTAESYAQHKFNDFVILSSFFLDPKFKQRRFKDLDNLETDEINKFLDIYKENLSSFSEQQIKKIAIQPFFLNPFSLCGEDCYKFYGIAVTKLTVYQINLFSLGCYYKNALREYSGDITEEILNDPDAFVERLSQRKNVEEALQKTQGTDAQSIVGMSKEDRKRVGITDAETLKLSRFEGKNLEEIALAHT